MALKDQGRPDEAVEHFKQTIGRDPQFAEAYNNLGNSYFKLGKSKEAITQYKVALSISPDSRSVLVNLGNALARRRELEEAFCITKKPSG